MRLSGVGASLSAVRDRRRKCRKRRRVLPGATRETPSNYVNAKRTPTTYSSNCFGLDNCSALDNEATASFRKNCASISAPLTPASRLLPTAPLTGPRNCLRSLSNCTIAKCGSELLCGALITYLGSSRTLLG